MKKRDSTWQRLTEHKSKHGLKTSGKRSFVIDFFIEADRHFTVEELYDAIRELRPEISYSTVYRTLRLLADCGLARECTFADAVVRYEPAHQSEHHDHLICRRCGKIIEFANDKIERLQKNVARKYGFRVSAHKLELYGICKKCQEHDKERVQ